MPRILRPRKLQRRPPLAPKPEPKAKLEVEPEPEPKIIRLYGDKYGDTFVDYETTNPQSQCGFLSKLPAEIRTQIYEELWRATGLSQHLLPHTLFPEGFGVTRYHHAKCITEHDAPDERGPPPGNLHYKESKKRRRTDPSFTDGTDPSHLEAFNFRLCLNSGKFFWQKN
ncbi:hypothetical protein QQX98_009810 [Neonectria punicea]|uniref:Uncharacterized protein n=1 Tax=Neonectria punicea TaxID=979145 RepID=A0ABR1GR97_9HYPO